MCWNYSALKQDQSCCCSFFKPANTSLSVRKQTLVSSNSSIPTRGCGFFSYLISGHHVLYYSTSVLIRVLQPLGMSGEVPEAGTCFYVLIASSIYFVCFTSFCPLWKEIFKPTHYCSFNPLSTPIYFKHVFQFLSCYKSGGFLLKSQEDFFSLLSQTGNCGRQHTEITSALCILKRQSGGLLIGCDPQHKTNSTIWWNLMGMLNLAKVKTAGMGSF